jgi:hypothetical protein
MRIDPAARTRSNHWPPRPRPPLRLRDEFQPPSRRPWRGRLSENVVNVLDAVAFLVYDIPGKLILQKVDRVRWRRRRDKEITAAKEEQRKAEARADARRESARQRWASRQLQAAQPRRCEPIEQSCCLLARLPLEIRQMIWARVVGGHEVDIQRKNGLDYQPFHGAGDWLALLRTCQQVYEPVDLPQSLPQWRGDIDIVLMCE